MRIQPHFSPSPRLTRTWRLGLVVVLFIGVFRPQSALAAPTWTTVAPLLHGDTVAKRQGARRGGFHRRR